MPWKILMLLLIFFVGTGISLFNQCFFFFNPPNRYFILSYGNSEIPVPTKKINNSMRIFQGMTNKLNQFFILKRIYLRKMRTLIYAQFKITNTILLQMC